MSPQNDAGVMDESLKAEGITEGKQDPRSFEEHPHLDMGKEVS